MQKQSVSANPPKVTKNQTSASSSADAAGEMAPPAPKIRNTTQNEGDSKDISQKVIDNLCQENKAIQISPGLTFAFPADDGQGDQIPTIVVPVPEGQTPSEASKISDASREITETQEEREDCDLRAFQLHVIRLAADNLPSASSPTLPKVSHPSNRCTYCIHSADSPEGLQEHIKVVHFGEDLRFDPLPTPSDLEGPLDGSIGSELKLEEELIWFRCKSCEYQSTVRAYLKRHLERQNHGCIDCPVDWFTATDNPPPPTPTRKKPLSLRRLSPRPLEPKKDPQPVNNAEDKSVPRKSWTKPFECPFCGLFFTDSSVHRRHTERHLIDSEIKNLSVIKSPKSLEQEAKAKKEVLPFVCGYCKRGFKELTKLGDHVTAKHNEK